jgi:CPA2 family monovalent cation:H+ antiporter-2
MPDHVLHLLAELSALVGVSALIAYVGQRFFRVVPLVGFLITGVVIGPHALGLVADEQLVEGAAEVGVILLLFTIGIEFSLERLARIRRLVCGGGALQVSLTLAGVSAILIVFGVSLPAAIYTGCLAALSSTIIALKLLADSSEIGSEHGQAALGVLIFQDMAVVGMVLLLPALAGQGGGAVGVALAVGKALAIIAVVLVLARKTMPVVLERIARACSPDIFLLSLVAICFGTAWLASLAGLGVSLGAFLAGLVVSESSFSEHALSEILPLRILFSVAFFVSIGMLLDPAFLLEEPLLVVGIVLGVFLLKAVTTTASLLVLRLPLASSLTAGLLLAQVGEFSFVLERQGTALGLFPAGSAELGGQAFIAATVVLMIATPAFAKLGPALSGLLRSAVGPAGSIQTAADPEGVVDLADGPGHVLIAGYGAAARGLTGVLAAGEVERVIMTLSPDGADEAERTGQRVVRGDYTRRQILEHAGIERAAILVVADDDPTLTERVVAVARALRPELEIVAQTDRNEDEATLVDAGASAVVAVEGAADRELARAVLEAVGIAPHQVSMLVAGVQPDGPGVRLSQKMKRSERCRHGRETRTVFPGTTRVCPECVAAGKEWVHLRVCMSCGYVGCCDSSPGRHAHRHFETTKHPVIKSWEVGEDWAWCYVDQVNL